MYNVFNLLFGWDYVTHIIDNTHGNVNITVYRVLVIDNALYLNRFFGTPVPIEYYTNKGNLIWITCHPDKYKQEETLWK